MDTYNKENWRTLEQAWFEYHCLESEDSSDAELWHHSHQQVLILGEDEYESLPNSTFDERSEAGLPKVYRIRFADGCTHSAFEDELLVDPLGFYHPDPPPPIAPHHNSVNLNMHCP